MLEKIAQTILIEKWLSGKSKNSTFYENVFNGARRLTCNSLRLMLQFDDKRVSKPCMINVKPVFLVIYSLLDFLKSGLYSAESALSFLLTPVRFGIQQIRISLQFDIESSLLNGLIFRGFSSLFLLQNDSKKEIKSENMMNFLFLLFKMMPSAKPNPLVSAVKKFCFFYWNSFLDFFFI